MRAPLAATALLSLFLSAAACAPAVSPPLTSAEYQEKAQRAYEAALETFHDRDWISVPIEMGEVRRDYAGTKWARLAQLRIADSHFHQASYPEAITGYREFLREAPNAPEVPYARYQVALCQFEARGDGALSPPLEERDLVNVRDADRSIASFLKDYPNYKKRDHLLYMQKWVRGMLARHELYVARYYLGRGKLDAAISRTEYALSNFKGTGLEAEALVLLGETHMKRREPTEAAGAFQIVIDKYPDSEFVIVAKKFMKRLETEPPLPHAQAKKEAK